MAVEALDRKQNTLEITHNGRMASEKSVQLVARSAILAMTELLDFVNEKKDK